MTLGLGLLRAISPGTPGKPADSLLGMSDQTRSEPVITYGDVPVREKNMVTEETAVTIRKHPPWLRTLLGSRIRPVPTLRQPSPEENASLLSRVVYHWIQPLLRTGYDRILEVGDVWTCPEKQRTSLRMDSLNSTCDIYRAKNRSYPEFWATFWTLKWWFAAQAVVETVAWCLPVVSSVMSRLLIEEIAYLYEGLHKNHGRAVGLLVGYLLIEFITVHVDLGWQYMSIVRGEAVRSLLISQGQQKLFRLGPKGQREFPASKITSLLSTDTLRIKTATESICHFVSVVPVLSLTIGILIYNLGVAGLAGIALFIVLLASTMLMGPLNAWLRKKSLPHADERISVVQEAVTNVRVIKFYGWEESFSRLISNARRAETWWLQKLNMANSAVMVLSVSSPSFSGMLAFVTRILIGRNLPPEKAFPSLTLFEIFTPISMLLATGISQISDGWNSLLRLNELFNFPDFKLVFEEPPQGISIRLREASFEWCSDENVAKEEEEVKNKERSILESKPSRAEYSNFPGLLNVNLDIPVGSLVMVVGAIGSGKSTLLRALAGQVDLTRGSAAVSRSISASLSHWSMSGTIRSNIVFGRPYDQSRYLGVIQACNLEEDCSKMENGDLTQVGERGVTLSGGQRARLALARCIYSDTSIVLLDDPLSAVDARVANCIFEDCIRGFLKGVTRVMTTHNWQLLRNADQIVWVDGLGGVHSGSLEKLMNNSAFMSQYSLSTKESSPPGTVEDHSVDGKSLLISHEASKEILRFENANIVTPHPGPHGGAAFAEVQNTILEDQMDVNRPESDNNGDFFEENSRLIEDEARARGSVRSKVLYEYFLGDSIHTTILMLFSIGVFVFSTGASGMTTVFLEFWTGHRFELPQGVYAAIYCVIVAVQALSFWLAESILCYFCLKVSSRLFDKAIKSVFRASMGWFDSNPVGRIVTRFTDDVANLDTTFTQALRAVLSISLNLIAQSVVTFVYMPWAALVLPPILLLILVLLTYYRPTTRELNRMSQVFRSTAFTVLTESISGVDVITGYGQSKAWHNSLDEKLDDMNYSFLLNFVTHFWIALRVNWCGLLITVVALFLCVYRVFTLSPSAVGLLMTSIPSMILQFTNITPYLAILENELNSVERLHELAHDIPQESRHEEKKSKTTALQAWPTEGRIQFIESSMRYRAGLPLAMKHLSLDVKGGSKVGICGRSGAGKSTLISALFRTVDLASGRIEIDGKDIATLGLGELRKALTIIPQEPILFKGTVRSNLDPFNEHKDIDLWEALQRSGVIPGKCVNDSFTIDRNHKFHLDMVVESGGSNFSLGERQLLTLSRALLRRSKILILDEATSSVDMLTDKKIQNTIATEFSHCTVLCIAHRLQTIVGYDEIIVLEAGQKVEMGPPKTLFSCPTSAFAALCREASITPADFL